MKIRFGLLALAAPLVACGDDTTPTPADTSSDTTVADTTPTDTAPGDTTAEGCLTAPPEDLTGTWAIHEIQTALVSNVPGIGTMNQESDNLYLVTIAEDGEATTMTSTLCDWETSDDANLTTTGMTQKLLDSLTPFSRTVTTSTDETGARLATSQGITLRGVEMDDPATDAFPTDATDDRIFDQDDDTQSGITLVISGLFQGELYVVHRHKAALDGCFVAADRVEGLTAWTTEQLILGASEEALLSVNPEAITHPDPTLSRFVMVRAEGTADCAALKAARETLFPAD